MRRTLPRRRPFAAQNKIIDELRREIQPDGCDHIHLQIHDIEELYNPLSFGSDKDLNPDIYDFIEQAANLTPSQIPLKIIFHGPVPESNVQEEIRSTFRRHYLRESLDVTWDQTQNNIKTLLLTLLGAVMMAIYITLAVTRDGTLFLEVLSVIGSFSLWEAANGFLLERKTLRLEARNVEQFQNAVLCFEE